MAKALRKKEIAELQKDLEDRKIKIEEHLKNIVDGKEELQDYNEMNDVMSKNDEGAGELAEIFTTVEIKASLDKTFKDINQALDLINKGDYGICKYCEKEISIQRLKIRPVSTSCVQCKSQFTN